MLKNVYVIGCPAKLEWDKKALRYHSKYERVEEANKIKRRMDELGTYVSVVAGSLKTESSKTPEYFIVYSRKKLAHEVKRK